MIRTSAPSNHDRHHPATNRKPAKEGLHAVTDESRAPSPAPAGDTRASAGHRRLHARTPFRHACCCCAPGMQRGYLCGVPHLGLLPRVEQRLRRELAHHARAGVAVRVPRVEVEHTPLVRLIVFVEHAIRVDARAVDSIAAHARLHQLRVCMCVAGMGKWGGRRE
eukprot:363133-Chlamydomonas_euryale.AAC.14